MDLKLAYWDNPWLRKKAEARTELNLETQAFIKSFLAAFHTPQMFGPNSYPIGLAATQVRSSHRIFAVCPHELVDGKDHYGPPKLFINAILSEPSDEAELADEGCLSFPGLYLPIQRPYAITVEWQDETGATFKERISGYYARQVMHENDHLNGVVFTDRLAPQYKKRIKGHLDRLKKKYAQK